MCYIFLCIHIFNHFLFSVTIGKRPTMPQNRGKKVDKNLNDNLDPQKPRNLTTIAEILYLTCIIVPREFSWVGKNRHPGVLV